MDKEYNISSIQYCTTYASSFPWESSKINCSFHSISYYDSKSTSVFKEYYYNITNDDSGDNYIIVRYLGSNYLGTFRARAVTVYMDKVPITGPNSTTKLAAPIITDTYFYIKIDYPPSDYVYFNLTNTDTNYLYFDNRIEYCLTTNEPQNYLQTIEKCNFSSLDYYKNEYSKVKYEYYYKINISSYSGYYTIVKYKYKSSRGSLYVQSSYYDFYKPPSPNNESLSIVSIAFIAIAGVALIGIIITIICYYRRKKAANNIAFASSQPEGDVSYKTVPLVQQNNMQPSY